MSRFVADTHALFWYLTGSSKLGTKAKQAFDLGAAGQAEIFIPAIVLAELYFLNEKLGQPLDFSREYQTLVASAQVDFLPFEAADVLDFFRDKCIPEMHDRMIVGLARRLGATCLSRDELIVQSGLGPTAW